MNSRLPVLILFLLGITATAAASCGGGQTATQPAVPTAKADGPGVVTGVVKFEGEPPGRMVVRMGGDPLCVPKHPFTLPGRKVTATLSEAAIVNEKGGIANVFVRVRDGLGNRVYAPPTAPVVLDQAGCQYEPHVFGVFVGQPIEIKNTDPTLHNVHAQPHTNNPFNFSQQPSTPAVTKTFDKPEIGVPMKCDLHGWMNAYANVVTNPFFAVTKEDGTFELRGLPAGTYTIEAWHEEFGRETQQITIADAAPTATTQFVFKAGPVRRGVPH
jgi:plastocyanin